MNNLNRISLVEQTTHALSEYIDSDELNVGEKVPSEESLCQRFGVSRTTIREALRMLQATGYVRLVPNKGAFVAGKNRNGIPELSAWILDHANQVEDVFAVRMMIEPAAAAIAAKVATANEKYMIMGLNAMFQEEAQKNNLAGIILYDERFHECIMKASHNSLVIEINKLIANMIREFRSLSFSEDHCAVQAVDLHNRIAQGIFSGDAESAEELMKEHLKNNVDLISKAQQAR